MSFQFFCKVSLDSAGVEVSLKQAGRLLLVKNSIEKAQQN